MFSTVRRNTDYDINTPQWCILLLKIYGKTGYFSQNKMNADEKMCVRGRRLKVVVWKILRSLVRARTMFYCGISPYFTIPLVVVVISLCWCHLKRHIIACTCSNRCDFNEGCYICIMLLRKTLYCYRHCISPTRWTMIKCEYNLLLYFTYLLILFFLFEACTSSCQSPLP